MEHGDLITERTPESADRLRGKADLGNQHDGSLSRRQRSADRFQIYQRLAATGHAEQQSAVSGRQLGDGGYGRGLVGGGIGRGRGGGGAGKRDRARLPSDPPGRAPAVPVLAGPHLRSQAAPTGAGS